MTKIEWREMTAEEYEAAWHRLNELGPARSPLGSLENKERTRLYWELERASWGMGKDMRAVPMQKTKRARYVGIFRVCTHAQVGAEWFHHSEHRVHWHLQILRLYLAWNDIYRSGLSANIIGTLSYESDLFGYNLRIKGHGLWYGYINLRPREKHRAMDLADVMGG